MSDVRNHLILGLIGLYLLLNWGFMLVRVPPGGAAGVPLGELTLVVAGLFLYFDRRWLPDFSRSISLLPFLLWWTLGVGRAILAVPEHGMWALRDATHVIDSMFLWVGFVFAANAIAIERFFVWQRRFLALCTAYALTYPFRDVLRTMSPNIEAAAGYTTTILFHYKNTGALLLLAAVDRLLPRAGGVKTGAWLLAGAMIAFAVGSFQTRTIYMQVVAVLLLLAWQRRRAFGRMSMALGTGAMTLALMTVFGIELVGRFGETVSADFFIRHVATAFGIESEGLRGPARGVGLRLQWWSSIWDQLTSSVGAGLFGLGFGMPLADLVGPQGQVVREPHNSFMSVLGRMGLTGITLFGWAHVLLVQRWASAVRLCRRAGYRVGQDRLLMFMVFFVLVWVNALAEDAFEKPYFAIPYYFFWGVTLHYALHLKRALGNEPPQVESPAERRRDRSHASPSGA